MNGTQTGSGSYSRYKKYKYYKYYRYYKNDYYYKTPKKDGES